MNTLKEGWFSEFGTLWPGQSFSLEVEEILHQEKSKYQDLLVFKSKTYGKVLVLDGVIQCTEKEVRVVDNLLISSEMLAHLPLCSHPDPKKVVVIGGGDGGVLREIAKHPGAFVFILSLGVEEITICEIDEAVIRVSKQFLPQLSCGFSDPRVKVFIGDGAEYLVNHPNSFDVVIVDSSDPVGPAQSLYSQQFYKTLRASLRDNGIVATQAECQWVHLDIIKELVDYAKTLFPHAHYAYTTIPTYPCGQIGFLLGSLGGPCTTPQRHLPEEATNYYNKELHQAAFVLPSFTRRKLGLQ